ncbi:hypothetical protein HanIR_Chr02g0073171 [Helianthus annuus]|nr:hypothetical protein HanIR_Chr02g0073171 [Helianthus annuus]
MEDKLPRFSGTETKGGEKHELLSTCNGPSPTTTCAANSATPGGSTDWTLLLRGSSSSLSTGPSTTGDAGNRPPAENADDLSSNSSMLPVQSGTQALGSSFTQTRYDLSCHFSLRKPEIKLPLSVKTPTQSKIKSPSSLFT